VARSDILQLLLSYSCKAIALLPLANTYGTLTLGKRGMVEAHSLANEERTPECLGVYL